jgi:predicted nucleic acid-binding protein
MKNSSKDRFEKKLIRFINEIDKGWKKTKCNILTYEFWLQHKAEIYKKYGFTDEEWNKACRLIRSWSTSDSLKTKRYYRKKELHESKQRFITEIKSGKQERLDEVGEEEINSYNSWFGDVNDEGLGYDEFLDMKENKKC